MAVADDDVTLEELARRATMHLLGSARFDLAAFTGLYDHLRAKAAEVRAENVISMQVLIWLREASGVIRNKRRMSPEHRDNVGLAHKLDLLLTFGALETCGLRISAPPLLRGLGAKDPG
jgi:hypothetical protein